MKNTIKVVGINDTNHRISKAVNGKRIMCPFYQVWKGMLRRCYSNEYQQRQPTYVSCSVCEEWLLFSNFKRWMETQDFDGKQLDKDLLIQGNKIYSPETCIFVVDTLNLLLGDNKLNRGTYPLGVSWFKGSEKFMAQIKSKKKHLGLFNTPTAAHAAWQTAKRQVIYDTALEQSEERLKDALLLRCTQLQYDIDNDLETIKL